MFAPPAPAPGGQAMRSSRLRIAGVVVAVTVVIVAAEVIAIAQRNAKSPSYNVGYRYGKTVAAEVSRSNDAKYQCDGGWLNNLDTHRDLDEVDFVKGCLQAIKDINGH
jgi:hypothetical protein